ncbi:MAG: SDR family oxidoreductase [Candidatus Eremiobacteraeota bacterium]|nr:SDR family oxidoreductase [Candidatus Eremiobacteraeota bacterium]
MIATKAGGALGAALPPTPPRAAVLVSGASTGVGYSTAVRLARAGFIVFAGVRRDADAQTLVREAGPDVTPIVLDVTDAESVARAAQTIAARCDAKLLGLVNNAGTALTGPLELLPLDEMRRQFEVNFFGAIALVQAFAPILRATHGRIVNVSAVGGKLASPFVGAYAASKFALEAASDALRVELRAFGVHVAVVEPGAVKSPLWERGADVSLKALETVEPSRREPYDETIRRIVRLSQRNANHGMPPERVAEAIAHALVAPKPHARYVVGTDAHIALAIARMPEAIRDRLAAAAIGVPAKGPNLPTRRITRRSSVRVTT